MKHTTFKPLRLVPHSLFILMASLLLQDVEAAPYAYIDATTANTTLDGAPLVAGSNFLNNGSGGTSTDNIWARRLGSSFDTFENSDVFETDSGSVDGDREATGNLVTSVTLPVVGTYEFVAVFAKNSNRDIAARIGSAPTASHVFTASNSLNANQSVTTPEIEFDNSYTNGRGANAGAAELGQVTTTVPNQTVQIYINGRDSLPGAQDERTQYDGIGYRAFETPPPTPKHRDVFLIAGQSNADGRGTNSELTGNLSSYAGQQPDVLIHFTNPSYTNADKSRYKTWVPLEPGYSRASSEALPTGRFGVEVAAGKVLSTQYANPAFIKVTEGGTALRNIGQDWYPAPLTSPDAGRLYKALIESTQQALAELTAAGDTYTVHAMFWHQGESDLGSFSNYGSLLTTLIESVRRDLNMPNLRVLVGELAPERTPEFLEVQWQTARSVPNAGFISSRGLKTYDPVTHFDTPSLITLGGRLGHALLPERDTIDFEAPSYAALTLVPAVVVAQLDRQDECAATGGLTSDLRVVTTSNQGEYTGGQAAGHPGASGAHFFTRRNLLPLAGANSMQADFFPGDIGFDDQGDADSTLLVAGWGTDANSDGSFSDSEAAIGLGLHQDGTFRIQIGNTLHLATGFSYQIDRWYRLTLSWTAPDAGGNRTVSLVARDLSTGTDLNGGSPVLSIAVPSAEFDGNPARWSGLGCRTTRGLVDNIRVVPQGFAAWTATLYPALAGGLLDDDDQDGICNALEFAFGLNPLSSDPSSALPQPVYGPAAATVSFSPLASQPGIFYQVDWSRDLSSWTTVTGTRSGSLLEFAISTAGEPSIFLRQRVEVTE